MANPFPKIEPNLPDRQGKTAAELRAGASAAKRFLQARKSCYHRGRGL